VNADYGLRLFYSFCIATNLNPAGAPRWQDFIDDYGCAALARYVAELLGIWHVDSTNFDDIPSGGKAPAHGGNVWCPIGSDRGDATEFSTRSNERELGIGEYAVRH